MGYKNIEDRRKYHKEYMREYRKWLKEHHFCAVCKKQDAYTLVGKYRCFECREKRRGHSLPVIEIKSTEPKLPRYLRFDFGLCYICGNALDGQKKTNGDNSHLCGKCYETQKFPVRIRTITPPASDTPKAWETYYKLKAKNASEISERSTQTNGR